MFDLLKLFGVCVVAGAGLAVGGWAAKKATDRVDKAIGDENDPVRLQIGAVTSAVSKTIGAALNAAGAAATPATTPAPATP